MKKLRQLCLAGVFTLALTTATFAGDIATGGFTSPPPPPPDELSAITPGDIPAGGIQNPQAMNDSAAEFALNLLQTMLSVF
jgi:ABC-type sugar transport system substrate-binding protein